MATIPGGVISEFGDGVSEQDRLFISEILTDLGATDSASFFRLLDATEFLSGADRFALLLAGVDGVNGGPGQSFVVANSSNNILYGGAETDTIFGVNGDDLIYGGTERDLLYGGAGDDTISGDGGDDQIYGNGGNDLIFEDNGDDTMFGGQGDDTIDAGSGDVVFGNKGNDRLLADGSESIIYGNEGDDTIESGGGEDTVYGGQGDDLIRAGGLNSVLYGNVGDDTLYGGDESDTFVYMRAGHGRDLILDFEIGEDVIIVGRDALPAGATQVTDLKIETIGSLVNIQLAGTGGIDLADVDEAEILEQIEDIIQLI